MPAATDPNTDPVDLVRRLDPDRISNRITQMRHEREALLLLLRAARRAGRRTPATAEKVGGH